MIFRYSITFPKKLKMKEAGAIGKVDVPGLTEENWTEESSHKLILKAIWDKHPGAFINGYCTDTDHSQEGSVITQCPSEKE